MNKGLIIAALLTIVATPALAAEYYVAQNPKNKMCKITEEKPDGEKWVMIGTGPYATKQEAKQAKVASTDCVKKKKTTQAN